MISTQKFIDTLRSASLVASIHYSYPSLVVSLAHSGFDLSEYEGNLELISRLTGIPLSDVADAAARPLVSIRFFRNVIDVPQVSGLLADHWMAVTQGSVIAADCGDVDAGIRALHFYGYKGGQARSTSLVMVAKHLADTGYRVLVVDADIEAPSLHLLFGCAIPRVSGSLMGLCDGTSEVRPVTAYDGSNEGRVDLIGCRPSDPESDLDFLAFALNASLDPYVLRRGVSRLRKIAHDESCWDIALFDHRTGLASSVIPTLSAWPGSTVLSLRPDNLSGPAGRIAKALFSAYPPYPGAYLSFSLDPEEKRDQHSARSDRVKNRFLEILADATQQGAEEPEPIDPLSLEQYFLRWYFDRALLEDATPEVSRLSKDNQDSISQLMQVLGITALPKSPTPLAPIVQRVPRTPSGASDAGWFIETREISTLMRASSAYSYILGRKGTGKTRIYREMHARGKGVPLFCASDFTAGGVRSQSAVSQKLLELGHGNFELFWWALLDNALDYGDGLSSEDRLQARFAHISPSGVSADAVRVTEKAKSISSPLTFLIDGVETAVNSRETKQFVEALLRVLSTVQNDSSLNEKIQFKLFIRPDLIVGVQNIEQQIAGRKLELRWDEGSIFNYMLAEIERKPWFNSQFPLTCKLIAERHDAIREGKVDRESYEAILLDMFPNKIRRNNLSTMTFLRTYFSDSVSESSEKRSSFYPRVVGSFLDHVDSICSESPTSALDESLRVSHSIIVLAFTKATEEFIDEIKQELYFALDLHVDVTKNRALVDELIESLGGLQTPFSLDGCIEKLQQKLGSDLVTDRALRDALRQMKEMGIFEIHPADPNKWRAGRLFKEALRMKYVR